MDPAIDELLPFLLRRENVARYEEGAVLIGDRRAYPFERAFVRCSDVESVARAIETMVTQGGGPSVSAWYAMVLAAREAEGRPAAERLAHLRAAQARLVATRPTNTALARRLERALAILERALADSAPLADTLLTWIELQRDRQYEDYVTMARYGDGLMADGDGILTMCFAETAFLLSLGLAARDGKRLHVFTPETRPYLQGARLTAPSVHELGIPVQIIGDGMPAYVLSQGKVQKYFTAADLVTLDGHVVNKIGTLQNAIAAAYYGVPYFAFCWGLDPSRPDSASVVIEERDPAEIRACRGHPTTIPDIDAYYPAFDITPPHLVAGVITKAGILSPYDLKAHIHLL
ncbi:MAG: eIF-2B alpha/beta/delta-like protein [Anaerolineae bacterium]|jgi:methylthioribose-1-phosphate isomerase|nr:eIF-2B alpha/beta/delta-like protein [Anaerolineae bacterium]